MTVTFKNNSLSSPIYFREKEENKPLKKKEITTNI